MNRPGPVPGRNISIGGTIMQEFNIALLFQDKDGKITVYYPKTKYANILDAPNVAAQEAALDGHRNNSDIHVTPEQIAAFNAAIVDLAAHINNGDIHTTAAQKSAWNEAAQAAADALAAAAAATAAASTLESRVARVEDGLFSNITGNPFITSFEDVTGINVVKGAWNATKARLEC